MKLLGFKDQITSVPEEKAKKHFFDSFLSFLERQDIQGRIAGLLYTFKTGAKLAKAFEQGSFFAQAFPLAWTSLNQEERALACQLALQNFDLGYRFMQTTTFLTRTWINQVRQYKLVAIDFMSDEELATWYSAHKKDYELAMNQLIKDSVDLEPSVVYAS